MPRGAVKKSAEWRDESRAELPRLLRDDLEVRGQVIAVLSEYLATREETAAILAQLRQMRADFDRRMNEQGQRIEEQGGRIEAHTEELGAMRRSVMGLGARVRCRRS